MVAQHGGVAGRRRRGVSVCWKRRPYQQSVSMASINSNTDVATASNLVCWVFYSP